jgi:hypothetical protein
MKYLYYDEFCWEKIFLGNKKNLGLATDPDRIGFGFSNSLDPDLVNPDPKYCRNLR